MPPHEADLDALMGRLACGDRRAFEPLYLALRPRALRLARLRLGEADAPDVAQAALLNVFSRASTFEAGRPLLPWFYAIVANEVRSRRRASGREPVTPVARDDLADVGAIVVVRCATLLLAEVAGLFGGFLVGLAASGAARFGLERWRAQASG